MNKLILSIVLFSSLANAIEFLCWKNGNIPAMAFESFVKKCDDPKNIKVTEQAGQKEVACVTPAQCIALTENVVSLLKSKTNAKSVSEIKRLGSNTIGMALLGSKFSGRMSQIICKGTGKFRMDQFNNMALQETSCPEVADCVNSEDILFNLGMAQAEYSDLKNNQEGTTISITPTGNQK